MGQTSSTQAGTAVQAKPPRLLALILWQGLYAVAGLIGGVLVLTSGAIEGTPRTVALFGLFAVGVSGLLATAWMWQASHRGRLASFVLNLILVTAAGFLTLQEVNLFNGLDALGESFPRGLPFLAIMAVGWLMSGWARRTGSFSNATGLLARWLMAIGAAALLFSVGLLPGLWTLLTRAVQPPAVIYLAVAVVSTWSIVILKSEDATRYFASTTDELDIMDGIAFVSPNLLGFLAFLAGPLAFSLAVSFTDWDGLGEAAFIGLENYVDLFTDPFFHRALLNILYFGVLAIPLSIVPALILAALLNLKLPGMKIFRALYFLPAVAGVVGVALIWKQLYNATTGYINYGILRFTDLLNLLPFVDLTAPQPQWLSDPSTAMLSMVIVFAFATIGFNAVLFLAGLQGVPKALYEAAEIDGASSWRMFRSITIPLLAPTTLFVSITTTILALQLFSEPFILNAPQLSPNGPDNATLTPVIYLYQNAFERFDQGYASAIGWVLFALIFIITVVYFRAQGDEGVLSK